MKVYPQRDLRPGLLGGCLEGIGLPDLVWGLCRLGETGVLKVTRSPVTRTLSLQGGRILFAASSDPNDRLGEMLLRQGQVTLGQLEQALAGLRSGRRLGALLVDLGALTPDELVEAVLAQVKGIALDLLTWDEGEYQFLPGPLPTEEVITLRVETSQLLLEGFRRQHSCRQLRASVGPAATVLALADNGLEIAGLLDLSGGERSLIECLAAGERSVESLCREVPLSNFETYQVLGALKALGVLVERGHHAGPPRAATGIGHLPQGGFAELLVAISSAAETGVLHVTRRSCERTFHIDGQRCVFATSSDPDDGLVTYLLRRGVISMHDRDEVANRLLSNKRVGTILREIGAIDDDDLQVMVREHVAEIVFDTVRWDAGEWHFVPGPLPTLESITLDTDVPALVAEGIRRVRSWTRIIAGCGGMDQPLALAAAPLDRLGDLRNGVDESAVIQALRSPQSPRRLCQALALDDFRVCQILWTLRLLGAAAPAALDVPAEVPAEVPADVPADVPAAPVRAAEPAASVTAAPTQVEPELPAPIELPSVTPAPLVVQSVEPPAFDAPGDAPEPAALEDPGPIDSEVQIEHAQGPAWELPADAEAVIGRFNAMHRVVYRAIRSEVGAGAVNFVRSCCNHLSESNIKDILDGVRLNADGSWDTEGLKQAICNHRIADPWPIYQQLLDQVFVTLEPHLGESRADRLRQKILELDPSS